MFVQAGKVEVLQVFAPGVVQVVIVQMEEQRSSNLVDNKIKEPEEAVDDALVCVWERVVALITSWDAQLEIVIVMIIDHWS